LIATTDPKDSTYLEDEEDTMYDLIQDLDAQHPNVEGLFTPERLLSPEKHVRAGALSIVYMRKRTRMINMSDPEITAYVVEHDGALFYESLDEVTTRKLLYYHLYLYWKMSH